MRTLTFLVPYTRRYLVPLTLTVVSMFVLVGVQLLVPWIIRALIGAVTTEVGWNEQTMAFVDAAGAAAAAAAVRVRTVLQFVRSYMAHVAGWGVVAEARQHIYEHLQRLSLRFYEDKQTGRLMSRMVNDSDMFERLIAHAIPDVFRQCDHPDRRQHHPVCHELAIGLIDPGAIPLIILAMRSFAQKGSPGLPRATA